MTWLSSNWEASNWLGSNWFGHTGTGSGFGAWQEKRHPLVNQRLYDRLKKLEAQLEQLEEVTAPVYDDGAERMIALTMSHQAQQERIVKLNAQIFELQARIRREEQIQRFREEQESVYLLCFA